MDTEKEQERAMGQDPAPEPQAESQAEPQAGPQAEPSSASQAEASAGWGSADTLPESLHQQLRKCGMLMMRLTHSAQREHLQQAMKEGFADDREMWGDLRNHVRARRDNLRQVFSDDVIGDLRDFPDRGVGRGRDRDRSCDRDRDPRAHGGPHGGPRGIAHAQGRLLGLVYDCDGLSLSAIVDQMDIRPSSASELVSKLEQQGYVRRETNADDKRVTNIFITEAGRAHYESFASVRADRSAELFGGLTAEEQQELSALLDKLAASLKEKLD